MSENDIYTSAVGAYVDVDPVNERDVTGLIVYVEVAIGEGSTAKAEVTALQAYAEIQPGPSPRVTALRVYVELDSPWSTPPVLQARPVPPELYDLYGRRLAYLSQAYVRRAFLMNDAGSGELSLARSNPAVTQGYLLPDHMVLIRSRYGLPMWAGVIQEIEYAVGGQVTLRLREALSLLSRWSGLGLPLGVPDAGGQSQRQEYNTPQSLIYGAIQRINATHESLLRVQQVQLSSYDTLSMVHNSDKSLMEEFHELHEAIGLDFWAEPYLDETLQLRIGIYVADERFRDQRSQVSLWEGRHLGSGCRYKVFSTFYGSPFGEAMELQITDTGIWSAIRLGDLISVHAVSLGPSGIESNIRVLGLEPDEESGLLILVGELYRTVIHPVSIQTR